MTYPFTNLDNSSTFYEKYPKTPRLKLNTTACMVTEKLDGTNASIVIKDGEIVCVGSKGRPIVPGKTTDNYGFASWVEQHYDELLKLGDGRHAGEWCGPKIQGNPLGLEERTWFIFNTFIPVDSLPACVKQVPLLYNGEFSHEQIKTIMSELWEHKSYVTDGAEPEGVCVYMVGQRQVFKETFKHSEGKWKNENK